MKKRWISLFVENDIGVLARISGLFSGKFYNLSSLTVGATENKTILRMTISLTSNDKTFEQVKKQLNRCVEVIKVVDFTDIPIHRKELMFVRIHGCSDKDLEDIFKISKSFNIAVIDGYQTDVLLESVQPEDRNNELAALLEKRYVNRIEIVRGGSVAVELL